MYLLCACWTLFAPADTGRLQQVGTRIENGSAVTLSSERKGSADSAKEILWRLAKVIGKSEKENVQEILWVKRKGYPAGFQTLCGNHQMKKQFSKTPPGS